MQTSGKKESAAQAGDQIELTILRTEHRVSEFLERNSQNLIYFGLGALVLLFLIFAFTGRSGTSYTYIPEAYRTVPHEISLLAKDSGSVSVLLSGLKSYPEIAGRYDGAVSQILLSQGKAEEAAPFIERQQKRIQPFNHSSYAQYANVSLLVERGEHAEALKQAKVLKETLAGVDRSYLAALNLLRIAALEKSVGTSEGERWAWHEFTVYLEKFENAAIQEKIISHFAQGKMGLKPFIEMRKAEMAKAVKPA